MARDDFWKQHLDGTAEHLTALNPDHYIDEGSHWRALFAKTAGSALGVLGIFAAYKRGKLTGIANSVIRGMAEFRPAEADAIFDGLREWGRDKQPWSKYTSLKDKLFGPEGFLSKGGWEKSFQELDRLVKDNRVSLNVRGFASEGALINDELTIERFLRQASQARKDITKTAGEHDSQAKYAREQLDKAILNYGKVDHKRRQAQMQQFGMRRATVEDIYKYQGGQGYLFNRHPSNKRKRREFIDQAINLAKKHNEDFMQREVDPWVFYDPHNKELFDLRYWPKSFKGVIDSLESDFAVPFVKFNPLAMFHIGDLFNVRQSPMVQAMAKTEVQPLISSNRMLDRMMLYINEELHDLSSGRIVDRGYLVGAKGGPGRVFLESISGAGAPGLGEFLPRQGPVGQTWSWLTKKLDVGYQKADAYYDAGYDISSFMTAPFLKFWKIARPYEGGAPYSPHPFGYGFGTPSSDTTTNWLFMRRARFSSVGDVLKQTVAGRKNIEDVTTLTVPLYHFFSRLDASLASMGFGLHSSHRGSAGDIFLNLIMYRALPVYAAIEGWKYLNYETENITGHRPDEAIADAYTGISVGLAHGRDITGITEWAKHVKHLFPGGDQIAELPVIGGLVDWDDSAEETQHELEEGEVPVRKGRWWPAGNTPFAGGRVQYFQPHWTRRVKSHYEFTDTLYGSEEEYFANAPYPTIRFPGAPIRHFITQPYHWEEKHYEDRPYLLTGGIPELEEFPLIGPLLQETVGEILKPTRRMHPEVWEQIEQDKSDYDAQFLDTQKQLRAKSTAVPQAQLANNDPLRQLQWGHEATMIDRGLKNVMGSNPQEVVVAVLDTGVDTDHPDLKENLLQGYNTITRDTDTDDMLGHGTHVAGIIGATGGNAEGISGGAYPVVKILPIKVLGDSGSSTQDSVNEGIDYAINWRGPEGQKVDIINMSLGTPFITTTESETVKKAHDAGILVVAAAGNEYATLGHHHVGSPAIWPEAIAVGAIDSRGRVASFSNRGFGLDVVAPGDNILSTIPSDSEIAQAPTTLKTTDSQYGFLPGTSMAAPYVSAIAAQLKAMRPDLTPSELKFLIESTAADVAQQGFDFDTGRGLVNAYMATSILSGIPDEELEVLLDKGAKIVDTQISAERQELMKIMGNATVAIFSATSKVIYDEYSRQIKDPTSIDMRFLQLWENIKEFGGFYGFATEFTYDTGPALEPQIATARAITSYRRSFWDTEIGGIPGELNEIGRRFIGHREKWENRYNPIPNQQPDWLPGDSYFIDYKTGDAFSKIKKGEMRLPGAAYEALYEVPEVEQAMQVPEIKALVDEGVLKSTDLYGPLTRFRILGDIAPWSEEFEKTSKMISSMNLTKEEREEVKEIRRQVKARNEALRVYPYRFQTANTQKEEVTVTKVLDTWDKSHEYFVYTEEHPLHPIKLAGLHVPMGKDKPEGREFLNQHIKSGEKIVIEYTADELQKFNNDTYQTISAVIYKGKQNLNLEAIKQGAVVEDEDDYSPAAVHARFTPGEIMVGNLFEEFAHLDTAAHTKLLQVRSPFESYWRRDLYGKDFQEWQDPVSDFLVPTYESLIARPPITGFIGGAIFGALFGRNLYGTMLGGWIGALTMGIGSLWRAGYDLFHDEPWVPKRRRMEWEINEYFDTLEYVKKIHLFEETADKVMADGFDVKEWLKGLQQNDDLTKERIRVLEDAKRKIKAQIKERDPKEWAKELDLPIEEIGTTQELLKTINKEITRLGEERKQKKKERENLPPLAQKALDYYDEAQKTMYGYDMDEPYTNIIAALPKKERQYLKYLVDAPEEERKKLEGRLSPYMERILYPMWGKGVPERPVLEGYFKVHHLPGPQWEGWDPGIEIQDIKVKYIRAEAMDKSEFNIWSDDIARARQVDIPIPKINVRERAETIRDKLRELLGSDTEIEIIPNDNGSLTIDAEIVRDKRRDMVDYLNENGHLLFS